MIFIRKISEQGFGIMEVLIAAGLLGGLALVTSAITKNSFNGQKAASSLAEARDITAEIANLLSDSTVCRANFSGSNPKVGFDITMGNRIRNATGTPPDPFTIGQVYGNRTVRLMSLHIGGPGKNTKANLDQYSDTSAGGVNSGTALVVVNWSKNVTPSGTSTATSTSVSSDIIGPDAIPRFFFMNMVLDASDKITDCTAAGGLTNTIWARSPNDFAKIYYNGGNVGIGTQDPSVSLEVTGPIRAGNAALNAACTTEGALAYDASAHAPIYCSSGGVWATVGIAPPIGSIMAWDKDLAGTPATLPAGWVPCDGRTISDSASPYNGRTIRNLNSATQDGSVNSGMFLRGGPNSGVSQKDATAVNGLNIPTFKGGGRGDTAMGGGYAPYLYPAWQTITLASTDAETHPPNMTVVWIMRIK